MRHKQILEVAAENPDASMEAVASRVPSATTQLVEQVLDEHGDPAQGKDGDQSESSDPITPSVPSYPDPEELSEKELETIRAIREHPEDSQRDLAEKLNVTSATVSNRVNSIEGFDWSERQTFAETVLGSRYTVESNGTSRRDECAELCESIELLAERVARIEQEIEDLDSRDRPQELLDDLALMHKVAHMCMKSDDITEDEEYQLLEAFFR